MAVSSIGFAQTGGGMAAMKQENAQLRDRVDKLEGELSEIKKMLQEMHKHMGAEAKPTAATPVAATPAPESVAMPQLTQEEVKSLKKLAVKDRFPVMSKLGIELYGYVKLDASYDTSQTAIGEYARWVQSEATERNDHQFSMTARQTRIGAKIRGPEAVGAQSSGVVEVDFYRGDGENHNMPRMRHAYMKLDWPDQRVSILAGQTWDVISPLYFPTVNFTVGWWQGNIGHRRPQVRLTKGFALGDKSELKFEAAAVRSITNRSSLFTPGFEDTGEDAAFPTLQGRTSVSFPFIPGAKPATIGASGHWGEEEWDQDASGHNRNYITWSTNVDVEVPVADWLTLQGEAFVGENLDLYFGGVGQGLNTTQGREVRAHGGWAAASLGPFADWRFNLGGGFDNPRDSDLNAGGRGLNRVLFGNVWYTINKSASVGLEVSQLHTSYKDQRDSESTRAQLAFLYKF